MTSSLSGFRTFHLLGRTAVDLADPDTLRTCHKREPRSVGRPHGTRTRREFG